MMHSSLKAGIIAVIGAAFLVGGSMAFYYCTADNAVNQAIRTVKQIDHTNDGIKELHYIFPTAADYIKHDAEDNKIAEGHMNYLNSDSPLFVENITNQILTSSGPEDDMIYTLGTGKLSDGSIVQLLYIGDPTTNDIIAASITWEDGSDILYTFYDSNATTIYDRQK